MDWLISLTGDVIVLYRVEIASMTKRAVCGFLRAAANGIVFLADLIDPPKKEKGLMLSGAISH